MNSIQLPEHSQPELNTDDEVKMRLHNYLAKYSLNYPHSSPSSASTDVTLSDRGCMHERIIGQDNYDTCFHCGVYVPRSNVRCFKSKSMNYTALFPPKTIYESMTRLSYQYQYSANPEYAKTRQTFVEWIIQLAEKFGVSNHSIHLSILILDFVMFKRPHLVAKIKLYAPICFLVACKTIELDEKTPYLFKIKRYCDNNCSTDDFTKAELEVFDLMDWNPLLTPPLQLVEFLMTQGVLFSNDEVEDDRASSSPAGLRDLSPGSLEIHEKSYSDASPNNALSNLRTPQNRSPMNIGTPVFFKQNSTPAIIERYSSAPKTTMPIEKKTEEILTYFEMNYLRLCTLLLKDIDLIECEPKVIAAAIIVFFRAINRVVPIWNSELEVVTKLKFSQVAVCHELIFRKYNSTFNPYPSRPPFNPFSASILENPALEPKIPPVNTPVIGQAINHHPMPKFEHKSIAEPIKYAPEVTSFSHNLAERDLNIPSNAAKPTDRKTIFSYPIYTRDTNSSVLNSYDYLREQLFYKLNRDTETLPRNTIKNSVISESYQPSRFSNQENSMSMGLNHYYTGHGSLNNGSLPKY